MTATATVTATVTEADSVDAVTGVAGTIILGGGGL